MRVPMSWLGEYVDLGSETSVEDLAADLTQLGLKLEALERHGTDLVGPLVVGRVLTMEPEPQSNGKTINWCTVDVGGANGTGEPQGIVCGAHNFAPGDLVVVVLPGAVLPGGFEISARKTYGHVSAGMICSERELGLGEDHAGIIVLPSGIGDPGDDAVDLLRIRDDVIEFEINPDRAYAMSIRGVAREAALAAARRGRAVAYRDPALRATPPADDKGYPVVIDDSVGCPVFVARLVSGFDPTATSPAWLTRRLTLAGMRPISLAVDVTNYVMLELGRPIHGYDADRLSGPLRVRRARVGEALRTLDGVDRALADEDLVVCDDSGIVGLGGVMGGDSTEISDGTTRVLIEAAHWDAASMFRSGRRHRLTSEAGKRNERGVDPTICEAAADRVAELLVQLGGGVIEPGVTVVGSPPASAVIEMPGALPERITGIEIDTAVTIANLELVGAQVRIDDPIDDWADAGAGDREGARPLTVTAPPWRPDLTDPFDLVEEVARLVGYDQVPSVLPAAPPGRGLTREQRLRRRLGRTLAGEGFVEVISFPFVGDADFDALGLPADDARRDVLMLVNPLSANEPAMTTTLVPGLLKAASRNLGRGAPGVALFETATVTEVAERIEPTSATGPTDRGAPIYGVDRRPSEAEFEALEAALPGQPLHLGVVLAGERDPA
ncbi:MAG: phenylalanine--tRNA ligase subunit beta, partial [Nocardioides sp.]